MAHWSWPVYWLDAGTIGADWVEISNVQGGTVGQFRQSITDSLPTETARIYGRRPDLMPDIQIGDGIKVFGQEMLVADYVTTYGITDSMDTWVIDCEDAFAQMGRAYGDISWANNASAWYAWVDAAGIAGVNVDVPIGVPDLTLTLYGQTLSQVNSASVARTILDSTQYTQGFGYWLTGLVSTPPTFWLPMASPWEPVTGGPTFTDGSVSAVASGQWVYDQVDFGGLANIYWDRVVAEGDGLTPQVAGTGERTYTFQTYNYNIAGALQVAQATLARTNTATKHPIRISALVEAQTSVVVGAYLDQVVRLDLRGDTYYAVVLGAEYSFDPATTRMTVTLAPYESLNFLTLNDTVLGRLDYNKLGF